MDYIRRLGASSLQCRLYHIRPASVMKKLAEEHIGLRLLSTKAKKRKALLKALVGMESSVMEAYEMSRPAASMQVTRKKVQTKINRAVQAKFGGGYHVRPFGSTVYGLDNGKSDLDLVIWDRSNPIGLNKKLPRIYNVRDLATILRNSGFTVDDVVSAARVPIVKCRDPVSKIKCDININARLGRINTELLSKYCQLNSFLQPVLWSVKQWAARNDFIGSSGGKFNNYTFALMTIAFFQTRGYLPNLQEGLWGSPPDEEGSIFWIKNKGRSSRRCDIRFDRDSEWELEQELDADSVLVDWFSFWADEFRYAVDTVDIRRGGIVKGSDESKEVTENSIRLNVYDPFCTNQNIGIQIAKKTLMDFRNTCRIEHDSLLLNGFLVYLPQKHKVQKSKKPKPSASSPINALIPTPMSPNTDSNASPKTESKAFKRRRRKASQIQKSQASPSVPSISGGTSGSEAIHNAEAL